MSLTSPTPDNDNIVRDAYKDMLKLDEALKPFDDKAPSSEILPETLFNKIDRAYSSAMSQQKSLSRYQVLNTKAKELKSRIHNRYGRLVDDIDFLRTSLNELRKLEHAAIKEKEEQELAEKKEAKSKDAKK